MKVGKDYYIDKSDILAVLAPSVATGLSIQTLLESLNLAPDLLDSPLGRISVKDGWRISSAHQSLIKEETHLMSNRPLKPGTTRFVFSNLVHCKTLQEGMEMLADSYNIVHGGNYNFVRKRGNCLSYVVQDSNFHYRDGASNFAIEFALIKIHCALSYMVGHKINPVKVCTKRAAIREQNHHLQFFSCNTLFNHPHFELAYDSTMAQTCFRSIQDIELSEYLLDYCLELDSEGPTQILQTELVTRILELLKHGVRSQDEVASTLGMSVATLRRKLRSLGTNYRNLLDEVGSELSLTALRETQSIGDVAEQLGYCDERSFKRAFRRWHGMSPAAFVRRTNANHGTISD